MDYSDGGVREFFFRGRGWVGVPILEPQKALSELKITISEKPVPVCS